MPKRINSRTKGKVGELEFVNVLKDDYGLSAMRTAQHCGKSGDAADVVSKELAGYHFEVKRVENLSLYKAMEQAVRDSKGTSRVPVVAHRRNHKDWLVVLNLKDFMELVRPHKDWIAATDEEV